MPSPRHLRNAPITEAVFDFRVKARAELRAEEFATLQSQLADRFPTMQPRRGFQATFGIVEAKARPPVVRELGLQGYFFKTADEKTVAQFRVDGFTFNRLHPYTKWEELFVQAMELWQVYSALARPAVITRLAVRYLNRIPLPPGPFELETYLRSAPIVPPELPQQVSGFLTRVTIHDPATDIFASIAQALEAYAHGQQSAVILDIDAFKQGEFGVEDHAGVEEIFNRLRALKNVVFFNSLTDEALRQFE